MLRPDPNKTLVSGIARTGIVDECWLWIDESADAMEFASIDRDIGTFGICYFLQHAAKCPSYHGFS